jgi:arabinogalactan endo-1,4-beta-galactosidase
MKTFRIWQISLLPLIATIGLLTCATAEAADQPFITGADVSLVPTLEKAGAVYRLDGKPGDPIKILADHGCNLFRVRLFVNPDPDYRKTGGAVQDLAYVRDLARRIKATGAMFLLDIHYSDNWADPGKQYTPADWKNLQFDALEQKVHDYTVSVMQAFQADGDLPDMVQVGNEITSGVLWPRGNVLDVPTDQQDVQWAHFARLINAGAKAVRSFQTDSHKIRIVIHIHGGGREGLPKWFFGKFTRNPVDFDVMGLSFYPAWGDGIDALKQNLADVVQIWGKDVLIAETSYPWHELPDNHGGTSIMRWPQTPDGQKQFLHDLTEVLRAAPDHHGIGFCYWYPEAIPVPGMRIWRDGDEALFDQSGNALPALLAFGQGE